MSLPRLLILQLLLIASYHCEAQSDSTLQALQKLPVKYINNIDSKIDKYSSRITTKTEKTLAKLSKWENKIHTLLLKVNPDAATKLFGNNQTTFSSLLEKIKEGKTIADNTQAQYDEYRDKLTTSLKYLEQQKDNVKNNLVKPISDVNKKITALDQEVKNTEAVELFIKERKNRLIDESINYIGKSKYLLKINKEAYYYVETLRNYKEIFSDKKKLEELANKLLNNIPAFQKFMSQNSQLASLFASPSSFAGLSSVASVPIVNGLASRASLLQFIRMNTAFSGTSNPFQQIQNQIADVNSPLNDWKNKLSKMGGMSNSNLPDFNPNTTRTKTFRQRLEFGSDLQFGKSTNYLPGTSDIALKIGYKLNDKSSAGVGVNYKMGFGNGWNDIHFSSQGLGFRTYLKWKLKNSLDVQGGSEWNYMLQFNNIEQLKKFNAWQQSALIGLSKNYKVSSKLNGSIQLLYDFLYNNHLPKTQPLIFRFGYGL